MNPNELLRIVDSLHRDKNIEPEVVFQAIESAMLSAAKKHYGEEADVTIHIDRKSGALTGAYDGTPLDPELIGRIGAQTAKQVIIQKIREAERDALLEEFGVQIGQMVSGIVQRADDYMTTVSLGHVEAILPRSEQIPGESHHANERVRAVVFEVKPQGNRVKVVLSRTRPQLVQRLFEQEIPEIADGVIAINAMAREPGYRSKVAVSSTDQRVDCVGACVGVRGNRIKNIIEELCGERIDIVRWSDDPLVLVPNALQPAKVDQVLLCDMLGRAIVLVGEDQLSLAIGKRGQNVRLASKLCGWDIEIMTADELEKQIDRAVTGFSSIDGMPEDLAQKLVEQGFLSYDDLSVIEPDQLMEMGELTEEQVQHIVEQAEERATEAEEAAAAERRRQRELDRIAQGTDEVRPATRRGEAGKSEGARADGAQASNGSASTPSADSTSADSTSADSTSGDSTSGDSTSGDSTSGDNASVDSTLADSLSADKDNAEADRA